MVNVNIVLSQAQLALLAHALEKLDATVLPQALEKLYAVHAAQNGILDSAAGAAQSDATSLCFEFGSLVANAQAGHTYSMVL